MTADEYVANRQAYSGKDICEDGYEGGKTKFRDRSVTKNARKERIASQSEKYAEEFMDKMDDFDKAERLGKKKAEMELGHQAATHTPDLGAGGDDVINMLGDLGFGDADVNSHIGSQWNGERISSIDQQACEAKRAGKGKEKMNVELRVCGKKEAKKMGCDKKNRARRKTQGLW